MTEDSPGAAPAAVDHVGIAVPSLDEGEELYGAILGHPTSGRHEVVSEGVRVAFFGRGGGRVELLEPMDPSSPVAKFLERHGPGVHHVCLRVSDVEAALERARARGAEVIPPGVRRGADGTRVAFLHPASAGGVLLELSEPADRPDDEP